MRLTPERLRQDADILTRYLEDWDKRQPRGSHMQTFFREVRNDLREAADILEETTGQVVPDMIQ